MTTAHDYLSPDDYAPRGYRLVPLDETEAGKKKEGGDNALVRGWETTKRGASVGKSIAAGNYDAAAQGVSDLADYSARNPQSKEQQEFMAAWERGDHPWLGGIPEVGRKVAKDWNEAGSAVGKLRSLGRNIKGAGESIVEQVPNAVFPLTGQVAGAAAGALAGSAIPVIGTTAGGIAGSLMGASAGNTAVEVGGMAQEALHEAGINPRDKAAVSAYLKEHGDEILTKAAKKGLVLGVVDTATAGLGGRLLTAPGRKAIARNLTDMGVDLADKAAVNAAMKTQEFAQRIAADAAYQASKKGAGNAARNVTAAAMEPGGEYLGETLGTLVANGDWSPEAIREAHKEGLLEALMSMGQSGITFAGQKGWQAIRAPRDLPQQDTLMPTPDAPQQPPMLPAPAAQGDAGVVDVEAREIPAPQGVPMLPAPTDSQVQEAGNAASGQGVGARGETGAAGVAGAQSQGTGTNQGDSQSNQAQATARAALPDALGAGVAVAPQSAARDAVLGRALAGGEEGIPAAMSYDQLAQMRAGAQDAGERAAIADDLQARRAAIEAAPAEELGALRGQLEPDSAAYAEISRQLGQRLKTPLPADAAQALVAQDTAGALTTLSDDGLAALHDTLTASRVLSGDTVSGDVAYAEDAPLAAVRAEMDARSGVGEAAGNMAALPAEVLQDVADFAYTPETRLAAATQLAGQRGEEAPAQPPARRTDGQPQALQQWQQQRQQRSDAANQLRDSLQSSANQGGMLSGAAVDNAAAIPALNEPRGFPTLPMPQTLGATPQTIGAAAQTLGAAPQVSGAYPAQNNAPGAYPEQNGAYPPQRTPDAFPAAGQGAATLPAAQQGAAPAPVSQETAQQPAPLTRQQEAEGARAYSAAQQTPTGVRKLQGELMRAGFAPERATQLAMTPWAQIPAADRPAVYQALANGGLVRAQRGFTEGEYARVWRRAPERVRVQVLAQAGFDNPAALARRPWMLLPPQARDVAKAVIDAGWRNFTQQQERSNAGRSESGRMVQGEAVSDAGAAESAIRTGANVGAANEKASQAEDRHQLSAGNDSGNSKGRGAGDARATDGAAVVVDTSLESLAKGVWARMDDGERARLLSDAGEEATPQATSRSYGTLPTKAKAALRRRAMQQAQRKAVRGREEYNAPQDNTRKETSSTPATKAGGDSNTAANEPKQRTPQGTPQEQVRQLVQAQLENLGRFAAPVNEVYAGIVAAYYGARAKTLGTDARSLYEQYPLDVTGDGEMEAEALAQEAPPEKNEALKKALRIWQSTLAQLKLDDLRNVTREAREAKRTASQDAAHMPMPSVLRIMGETAPKLKLQAGYLLPIMEKHEDVPPNVYDNLPALIYDPLFIFEHKDGSLNVVIKATTDKREPIIVGVREGEVRTVTPQNNEPGRTGWQRLAGKVDSAVRRGEKLYAYSKPLLEKLRALAPRNNEASVKTEASATVAYRTNPVGPFSDRRAMVVTRQTLVNKHGKIFYKMGALGVQGFFDPKARRIALLEDADASTWAHEVGHFFFDADIALADRILQSGREPSAQERALLDDVSTLLAWHGITGDVAAQLEQWRGMDAEQRRPLHERQAVAFERYLMEGKAPTEGVRGYFERMKQWLLDVYRSLKGFARQHPEMGSFPPDVRAVFDRMLGGKGEVAPRKPKGKTLSYAELQAKAGELAADEVLTGDGRKIRLQNRDRAGSGSQQQMNKIAAHPDYLAVAGSNDMMSGAPVVFGNGDELPAGAVVGRAKRIEDGRRDRYRVHYAVVEAGDIITSHGADGTSNASYATGEAGKLRAVAGNGRAAGLIEAWQRGTMDGYKAELLEEAADEFGLDADAVAAMKHPVLVRVMSEADIRADMGDRTNTTVTAELTPQERAANDAKRIDLTRVDIDERGQPTRAALDAFIQATPEAERAGMLDARTGEPTKQAAERFMAAIFKQAYQSDELVRLYAQATDPDARNVLHALAQAAPVVARLSGKGQYDLRAAYAGMAHDVVNAARRGENLRMWVKQDDFERSEEARILLDAIADDIRAPRRMGETLTTLAKWAQEQADIEANNAVQGGFAGFGDNTKPREQLFKELAERTADARKQGAADASGALFSRRGQARRAAPAAPRVASTVQAEVQAAERLARALTRSMGEAVDVRAVVPDAAQKAVAGFAERLFGRRVVFFESQHAGAPEGVFLIGRVLYVNANAANPAQIVMGHELWHSIAEENPQLARAVEAALRAIGVRNFPEYARALERTYTQDGLNKLDGALVREEFTADVFGHMLGDPQMLREIAARTEPNTFRRLVMKVWAWLNRVLRQAKADEFLAAHVADIEAARRVVLDALEIVAADANRVSVAQLGQAALRSAAAAQVAPRFSFAGKRGAAALDAAEEGTHRMDNLAVARSMERAGKDAKTVKMATGWERGKDGKWRYEIADGAINTKAELKEKSTPDGTVYYTTKLGDIYNAPELFKAYPYLAGMDVVFQELAGGVMGMYDGVAAVLSIDYAKQEHGIHDERLTEIEATPEFKEYLRSMDDAAQIADGFESARAFDRATAQWDNSPLGMEYNRLLSTNRRKIAATNRVSKNALSTLVHEIQHAIQGIEGFAQGTSRYRSGKQNYRVSAGETEARNTEARLNMTPEQRRATLAEETEDVAREDQIVLEQMLGGVAESRSAPQQGAREGIAQRIISMVRAALQNTKGGNKAFIDFARMTDDVAARTKKDAGLDVAGYTHTLDESGVRHINNNHGNAETERQRNQIAITEEDFARLPEVVAAPDAISRGEDTEDGKPTVVFQKKLDGTVYYVQEVRAGRKKLVAKTLWKTRDMPHAAAEAGGAHTSETSARSTSTGADSVSSNRASSQAGGGDSSPIMFSRRGQDAAPTDNLAAGPGSASAQRLSFMEEALQRAGQVFTHPGRVSLWDKTIGTMRHLAERVPAFKAVYEAATRSVEDVSTLANWAMDAAPRWIPKLEGFQSINPLSKKFQRAVSAKDAKAVAAPLFEGTLSWARDVDGSLALLDDLQQKYDGMSTREKGRLMVLHGKLSPNTLKAWQGMSQAAHDKAVNGRFEREVLRAGVVFTDAELRAQFGLNDQQISLYREARAGINRSLDLTARADMLRLVAHEMRSDPDAKEQLRRDVLDADSLDGAQRAIRAALDARAAAAPKRAEELRALASDVAERVHHVYDLMGHGYAPLSRFGRFTVDVVDKATGERLYFGMYESKRESNLARIKLAQAFPEAEITQGTLSEREFELFQGVTPETLEHFGEALQSAGAGDAAQDAVFQEYLRRTKNNHSALKRMIHRKGIAGYSEDVGRVLASFIYSNARAGSMALNAGDMERAITAIPKEQGELKDVAVGLRDYLKNPREGGQIVRSFLFAQYLGGSIASAMVNATQPWQVTMPWLSQYGGMARAARQVTRAYASMTRRNYEPALARALKAAEEDGTVSPQEVHQLMAQARGVGSLSSGDGTKKGAALALMGNTWQRLKLGWGVPFALAEQMNRRAAFIAAWRTATEQLKMDEAQAAEFARRAVEETQFIYTKANKPVWARGTIGGSLMTFKTYSVSYLELMHRMWAQGGKEGKRAVAWSVAMLLLVGGAGGLPFMEDAEDIIDGAGQLMGYNISSKHWRDEFLRKTLGEELGSFMESGMSALPGMPVDVSGRLGMGNLIPGTGLMLTKQDRSQDLKDIAGAAGDFVSRAVTGIKTGAGGLASLVTGDVDAAWDAARGAAREFAPKAVTNAYKGVDMWRHGMYRDSKGYKVIDTKVSEALAKLVGFQPVSVARVQEANSFMQRSKSFYQQKAADIRLEWAQALFEKDDAKLQRVREKLADWNRKNPEQKITVDMRAIWRRVREMKKDRSQRLADTMPKALKKWAREYAAEQQLAAAARGEGGAISS